MPVTAAQPTSLRALVDNVAQHLTDGELVVRDMTRAGSLELDPTMQRMMLDTNLRPGTIRRLEGDAIRAQAVMRHDGPSPIRYFLDGTQRTLPVWRVGTMPVIASVTAAAILTRTTPADIGLVHGTLSAGVAWILPLHTGNATLNRIGDLLQAAGGIVVDPLQSVHEQDPEAYAHQTGFYTHLLERSFDAAKTHREQVESHLLRYWQHQVLPLDRDAWIVADGRLRSDIPNAIGLVKEVQAQHLVGEEAIALYDLPIGHRTGAYTLVDDGSRQQWDRTMWYLRMQSAASQDARHGLIRLETAEVVDDLDVIDRISSWILAERAPRASSDTRWPTLLYPIHLLERMLKRRIQTITAGWPT